MLSNKTLQWQLNNSFETYGKNIAIEYHKSFVTYDQLKEKSNYIANNILSMDIKKGTFIGILIEDKLELISVIIGIIKAGCVFVPLDSNYPNQRIQMMIEASDLAYVFTDETNIYKLQSISKELNLIKISKEFYETNKDFYQKEIKVQYEPEDELYIYFTSGTTGKPKGILGKNIGLLQFVKWEIKEFDIDSTFRVSQFTSQCHDPYLRDIFVPLCAGGTICIPSNREIILETGSLVKWIEKNNINLIHCTPSLFKIFNWENLASESYKNLKYVMLAGERISPRELSRWYGIFDNRIQIVSLYGPTETTLAKLFYRIQPEDTYRENIPIGKAITGAKAIVLDKNMSICSTNKMGEIYIRTPYRTYGYYKDSKLNEEKFLINPFNNDSNDIIYKTGDLGRVLENGDIEFLGRTDRQVKIRGFRVELNEIENVLLSCESIKDAVVVTKQLGNENDILCAYIVRKFNESTEGQLQTNEIKEYLSHKLPNYMLPAYYIYLDSIPLNTNGKIDYKQLPDIEAISNQEVVPPKNVTEEKLQKLWIQVLGVSNIGVKTGFLDMGGNSLNAMKLILKIYEEFNIQIPLTEIFKNPTIEALSNYIQASEKGIYENIAVAEKKDYYVLSPAQRRMYILNQFSKESTSYNMPIILDLEGALERKQIEEALRQIIKRHETLRTSFEIIEGEQIQKIHEEFDFMLETKEAEEKDIEEIIKDFIKPFNLSKSPLFRAKLIKINENRHLLMTDMHHIILDGTSRRILVSEFARLYNGEHLPALRIQYKDYAVWQNKILSSELLQKQEQYWLERFMGTDSQREIPVLNMATDYQRPTVQSFDGTSLDFEIDKVLTQKLHALAKENNATLYMVLLSAYNTLLYKYTGQEDIVVGSPIAGRPHIDLENILGMFVNTLAMRNNPKGNKSFRDFLSEVRENSLKAYQNQDYQFEELVERLNIKRDTSRNTIFDTMLVLQNMDVEDIELNKLKISLYKLKDTVSKFDITLSGVEGKNGLFFSLQYCLKLFKQETMERMITHFKNILKQIVINPKLSLNDIEIMSEQEKEQISKVFNNTKSEYPKTKTIHELFQEQALRTPENVAVAYGNSSLTYKEVNEKANQLARTLRKTGAGRNVIIGIMTEKSLEMIIGIMGILKSGSAYVPIDPQYPKDRLAYMLKDSNVNILLTQGDITDRPDFEGTVINLDDLNLYKGDSRDLEVINESSDLLYLIYTSGSTGKPKGAMLEHKNLVNLISFEYKKTNIDFTRVLQFTNLGFDVCYQEVFSTLLHGGELYIIDNDKKRNVEELLEFIEYNKIQTIFLPTSYLKFITSESKYINMLPKILKHIVTAGEQLTITMDFAKYLKDNNVYLHNHYGPSEAHVVSTYTIYPQSIIEAIPPIGKPISNTKLYIVGQGMQLCPIGVIGELYIAGDCVGRGYLNSGELETVSFMQNIFCEDKSERMYKTGDLARWMPDGNIEFIGRKDYQVKIRGYRIELGEIQSCLKKYEDVKDTIVVAEKNENGETFLCAYIVPNKDFALSELRSYLINQLPEYMIPSYFMQIEKIPLTQNGKIDTKALPEPEGKMDMGVEYEAPRNEIEEMLTAIWQEVLCIKEKIGINENFFELGGHSLKATILASQVYKELNVELPLQEIFKNPTIKQISEYFNTAKRALYNTIKLDNKEEHSKNGYYPTSSPQKRMYILSQYNEGGTTYNIPSVLTLEGEIDKQSIENAFAQIVKRHEAFRTSFKIIDGEPMQKIHEQMDFKIDYQKAKEQELEGVIKDFVRSFDLSTAPLLRVRVIKLSETKHILVTDMHHIISDGVSIGILISELSRLYSGQVLPELKIQYKDYAVWQQEMLTSQELSKQEQYWVSRFAGEIPILEMPTDYPRPTARSYEGASISFKADKELTEKVYSIAKDNKATLYMVLLSAYNTLLYRYTGQEDIIIGTPIAGRPHPDLQNIIGMFVNTLAMRNNLSGDKSFKELLKEVKENSLKAYTNQEYQFEELVERLNIKREQNNARSPLFDTMFALQNMDIKAIELEKLKIFPCELQNNTSKFDIALDAIETEEGLYFNIQYCTKLFRKETVERISRHFINILKEISHNPRIKLKEIEMLNEEEKEQILVGFNSLKGEYPIHKTVHQLFEEQTERTPNNIAVVFGESTLTYKELNEKANQLARVLRIKGIESETIVGIMAERSIEMVIGVFAILKAGGAYLPIDPEYPKDRINYILEDVGLGILLTQQKLINTIDFKGEIINLDNIELYTGDSSNLQCITLPDNIIYTIYTSGTTGNPKGILTEHRNVINYTYSFINKFNLTEKDITLQQASFTFDGFVEEVYSVLLIGGKVVLPPNEYVKDVAELSKIINRNKVTILSCSPLILSQFNNLAKMDSVHTFLSSSDILKKEYYTNIIKDSKVYNMYGPTETTVCATCYSCSENDHANVSVGKPMNNYKIYILDKNSKPVPIGVTGEVYISGAGVARGYRNESLEAKFIQNPFEQDLRMYRTGDLARWMENGNIEFFGRSDHQVKIRGYRIELGEIESRLLSYEFVKEAVVLVKEDHNGEKYLCAYITADKKLTIRELRGHLAEKLPEYMIPAYFVRLDRMPLTTNGKTDRKALADKDRYPEVTEGISTGVEYQAPTNRVEEILITMWNEILNNTNKIGINDNFFELGGNSIKLMELAGKINKELQTEISLAQLLRNLKVKELADHIINKYQEETKEAYVLFNDVKTKKIFCFPPVTGYGIIYNELSNVMEDYSLYAFNFVETDNRIEEYVDIITSLQAGGSYSLIGYCLGGRMAFAVAKELEKRGYKVSDLIILDGYREMTKTNISENQLKFYEEDLTRVIERDKRYVMFKDEIVRKSKEYYRYSSELVDSGVINGNIHLITSISTDEETKEAGKWSEATEGKYVVYSGVGEHNDMLEGGFVKENGTVIRGILG